MELSLFAKYRRRIRDAKSFADLVVIDAELRQISDVTSLTRRQWLLEELELRAGPTVYTTLLRLEKASASEEPISTGVPGVENEDAVEEEDHFVRNMRRIDIEDDAAVDAFIEEIVEKQSPAPWTEENDSSTAELIGRTGFLEMITKVESEEGGRWPSHLDTKTQTVLTEIANTTNQAEVVVTVQMKAAPLGDTIPESDHTVIQDYANERLSVLRGVENNSQQIQLRRRARAMGMTPAELVEMQRVDVKTTMPYLMRSTMEVLHEERESLDALNGESEQPDLGIPGLETEREDDEVIPARMRREMEVRRRIQDQIQRRAQDKRAIDDLLSGGMEPPASGPRPTGL